MGWGLVFKVWRSRVGIWVLGSEFCFLGLGFGVWDLGCGFRVQGSRFRVCLREDNVDGGVFGEGVRCAERHLLQGFAVQGVRSKGLGVMVRGLGA